MDSPTPASGQTRLLRALLVLVLLSGALTLLLQWVLVLDLSSFDGFWHLSCGRLISELGAVPRSDPLCFTTEGYDWINLNWLAQLLVYRLFLVMGFAGPLALASLLFAVAVACCAQAVTARNPDPSLVWLLVPIAAVVLHYTYGIRPRNWTFAFLALFGWILARPDPEDRLGWLPAAILASSLLAWNNLHGGFVYGYGLLGMDLLGTTLGAARAGRPAVTRRALLLTGVILVGLLGFASHPHGFDALIYAVTYPLQFDRAVFDLTLELQPPPFDRPLGWILLAWTAACVTLGIAQRERVHPRDALVFVCFALLAFRVRRGVVPLLLLSAPALAELASAALGSRASAARARIATVTEPAAKALPATLVTAALAWALLVAPGRTLPGAPGQLQSPAIDPSRHPVAAVGFLRGAPQRGRILNTFRAGGLLGWALYPERRVFIDGRGDLFSRGPTFAHHRELVEARGEWRDLLERYAIHWALLADEEPLLKHLQADPAWSLVLGQDGYSLLRRTR